MSSAKDIIFSLIPPAIVKAAQLTDRMLRRQCTRINLKNVTRLHLGCGKNIIPGWTNIDCESGKGVTVHDLSKPLPLASASIDFIYSEHFIEHITRSEAAQLLSECYRVLKPTGTIRISTPDLKKLLSEYHLNRTTEWRDMGWLPATPCALINEGMRLWGHQFVYDIEDLALLFHSAGFNKITPKSWGESSHRELQNLECRPYHYEIIIEAIRNGD